VIRDFYTALGLFDESTYKVRLSVRDPETPEKYLGTDEIWQHSENVLKQIAEDEGLNYFIGEGEAAFYGPKLDFMFSDAIGREWQLGTVQLDFNMPARFELEYTDKDSTKKTPVMIHRAIAGSLERFLSVIIEHFAGNFPLWLAPVQVEVIPVGDAHIEYAKHIRQKLLDTRLRVSIADGDDGFGKKVLKAKTEKVPYFLIVGDNEMKEDTVTVESRDTGESASMSVAEFLDKIYKER
jgi:threonyl-tRNA synthetase